MVRVTESLSLSLIIEAMSEVSFSVTSSPSMAFRTSPFFSLPVLRSHLHTAARSSLLRLCHSAELHRSHIGTFVGSVQFFVLFCCVVSRIRIIESAHNPCIKTFPEAVLLLLLQIFFIDQALQIIQFLNCFCIGKALPFGNMIF